MYDISSVIQSGAGNVWLLLPTAVVLGALHALEPGHSKSMMTAFIVAIHGTAAQAILLAVAATVAHTMIVWALAVAAWLLGDTALMENAEPWLLFVGGLIIIALALRLLSRLRGGHAHYHGNDHGHGHEHHHHHAHDEADGDAHAAAHAAEPKRRIAAGRVTNADVAWFGFSGGLMPCPAAFAVLLACLHQEAYALGIVMVAAFSIGLALMLVAIGVAAAWGASVVRSRITALERYAEWAPYLSAGIVLVIGLVVTAQGVAALGLV